MDTKLNIASVTKMFTAVAIFQLIEQGKLSLTDTVGKILPDYPNKQIVGKVTVHHLLSHSSGLGDYHGAKYICRKGVFLDRRELLLFADEPLSFEPGERMHIATRATFYSERLLKDCRVRITLIMCVNTSSNHRE